MNWNPLFYLTLTFFLKDVIHMKNNNSSNGGIGFCETLTIAFSFQGI